MPATAATRRARLLSRATGTPLAAATYLARVDEPLLRTPTTAQRTLEGEFFDEVRDLHYCSDAPPPRSSLAQRVVIERIVPRMNRLDLMLSPETLLAKWITPAVPYLDEDGVLGGVPGLRMQILGPDRVSLTRIGERAEIVLVGAATDGLAAYISAEHDSATEVLLTPGVLHTAEVEEIHGRPPHTRALHHDSVSALVRRFGFLSRFRPWGSDCWAWMGAGTAVEVFGEELDGGLIDSFIEDMTSPWVEPRLRLQLRDGDDRTACHLFFGSDRARDFLQVRLRRSARPR